MGFIEKGRTAYPVDVITDDSTERGVMKALAEGPYGRCVYKCDNDVVDHQGTLSSFIMTGFTSKQSGGRATQLHGTHGEIHGDGLYIKHYDFGTIIDYLTYAVGVSIV